MTTYYVSLSGSDSNDGTVNKPFLTMSKAINICNDNDMIKIYPGNISSIININKQVTISSTTTVIHDVVLTGNINIQKDNITLKYLTLNSPINMNIESNSDDDLTI